MRFKMLGGIRLSIYSSICISAAGIIMSFFDKLLGRPLSTSQEKKHKLTVITGVPALGLDALASTAYGPEAALMILLPLGAVGLHYFFITTIAVVFTLVTLYFSYRQTAAAYPNGGGAYTVASENLGKRAALWAAIALLLDYFLNVAVGIAAGIGAIVSAIPSLQPHTLMLCLLVLLMLTIINLRGIRESGLVLVIPTVAFIGLMSISFLMGLMDAWQSGGQPRPIISPPAPSSEIATVSMWLLLGAFANGLTAMTGIEAVSNAVPLFRKPNVKNAQWTLTIIVVILGLFLLCLGYLCPTYHIIAMDESQPGYQTILSQLVEAIAGKGVFYYFSIFSIFIVLAYSAQTSFADFPRVCRLLAEDNFLPGFFAERGRRLVYSHGIIVLAFFSAVILIAFRGITNNLIPLFAVGAFSAFLFSQIGMVMHWFRKGDAKIKLIVNAIGAVTTSAALIIIIATKFIDGAWIVVIIAPILAWLLTTIRRHYLKVANEIEKLDELKISKSQAPIVIIPIHGWDRVAEKAIQFGLLISKDVIAIHVSAENDGDQQNLKEVWAEKVAMPASTAGFAIPILEIIHSPYRRIYKPILSFVKKMKAEKPGRFVAIVIPELVESHWYEHLLHNIRVTGLRTLIFLSRDQRTVVITIPWYLHDTITRKSRVSP